MKRILLNLFIDFDPICDKKNVALDYCENLANIFNYEPTNEILAMFPVKKEKVILFLYDIDFTFKAGGVYEKGEINKFNFYSLKIKNQTQLIDLDFKLNDVEKEIIEMQIEEVKSDFPIFKIWGRSCDKDCDKIIPDFITMSNFRNVLADGIINSQTHDGIVATITTKQDRNPSSGIVRMIKESDCEFFEENVDNGNGDIDCEFTQLFLFV